MPTFFGITVNADSIVRAAGAIPDDPNDAHAPEVEIDEEVRADKTSRLLGAVQNFCSDEERRVIFNEIAAKYLPELTTAFKSLDTAYNAPMSVINAVSHTPYFIRFSQTSSGSEIVSLQATRMAHDPKIAANTNPDNVAEVCQFLSTLLMFKDASLVSDEVKEALTPRLRRWKGMFPRRLAEETSDRCLSQLGGRPDDINVMLASVIKMKLQKGVESCNISGCSVGEQGGEDRAKLLRCSRCRTINYCSQGHQKQDWPRHKKTCFATSF